MSGGYSGDYHDKTVTIIDGYCGNESSNEAMNGYYPLVN